MKGREITSFKGEISGRTATLEDGRQLLVRDGSRAGPPTLELQLKNDSGDLVQKAKVRYDD